MRSHSARSISFLFTVVFLVVPQCSAHNATYKNVLSERRRNTWMLMFPYQGAFKNRECLKLNISILLFYGHHINLGEDVEMYLCRLKMRKLVSFTVSALTTFLFKLCILGIYILVKELALRRHLKQFLNHIMQRPCLH